MKKLLLAVLGACALTACGSSQKNLVQDKVDEFAVAEVGSEYLSGISDNGRQVLNYFRQAADEVDNIYWDQSFGAKSFVDSLQDASAKTLARMNYGPWSRIDDKPFVKGYGTRPLGANFYPADMGAAEFEGWDNPLKYNPYTLVRRGEDGSLECVWYHDAYKVSIDRIADCLKAASDYTIKPSVQRYLLAKIDALRTDDYYAADTTWLGMKDSKMDLVIGPNETSDDRLYGVKASYEAYVLLKDLAVTAQLAKYAEMIPEFQKRIEGSDPDLVSGLALGKESTIYAYDLMYSSGAGNAGVKLIAKNLPYNEKVREEKGSRTLIFNNVILEKYRKIIMPAGRILLCEEQRRNLDEKAFFWNIALREVAHSLGVKTSGAVSGTDALTLEEIKGDVLGVYMNCLLVESGEMDPLVSREDALTAFVLSTIRSARFGSNESLGLSNVIIYNYLKETGAFSINVDGLYVIDYDKAFDAVSTLARRVMALQSASDGRVATDFIAAHSTVPDALRQDFAALHRAGIPTDVRFRFVW